MASRKPRSSRPSTPRRMQPQRPRMNSPQRPLSPSKTLSRHQSTSRPILAFTINLSAFEPDNNKGHLSTMLRFSTAGESHGESLVALVSGLPAGVPVDQEFISRELWRRQKGYGRGGRMRIERDTAHILTGVRHGKTIGSPVAMTIANNDW